MSEGAHGDNCRYQSPHHKLCRVDLFQHCQRSRGQRAWSSVLQVRETGFGRVSSWLAGWLLPFAGSLYGDSPCNGVFRVLWDRVSVWLTVVASLGLSS